MSEATESLIGQLVGQRYQVTEKIADGGMATVYKATDTRLDRTVAFKVMHIQLARGPHRDQFIERFQREARSAAAITNPHIVQIYDTGTFDGLNYLVMEYVHGVNLRHEMVRQGTFTVRETLRLAGETLEGLAAAHAAGVVHRDIKPENIMINDRGHAQITDFGLAKAASQATLATTGMLLGTAAYLAPEMIEDNQATPQGDLYSVGIMMWEMLTGSVPFESDNPVTMVFKHVHEDIPPLASAYPGMPRPVSDFIAALTGRQVDQRPADGAAALALLHTLTVSLTPSEMTYRLLDGQETHQTTAIAADDTEDAGDGHDASSDPSGNPTPEENALDNAEQATTPLPPAGRRPRTAIVAVVGAVLAVALVCGGGFAWWYYLGPGSYWEVPAADDVACTQNSACTVEGASFDAYKRTLDVMGMPYAVSRKYSDTVPEGHIVSTDPANVNDHVGKRNGQTMRIIVSKGVKQLTIPADIADPDSDNGKNPLAALRSLGFDNIKHSDDDDQYSQNVPQGALLSITPQPGASIDHNAEVTVVLSKGPMPVTMPKVVGGTRDEAQAALNELRLTANVTEAFSDSAPAGEVISSSVKEGTQLHWGDTVDLVVSKGPETVVLQNYVGQRASDAKSALEGLGFTVDVQSQLTLDPGQDKKVASQDPQAGTTVRLRNEHGEATTITLKMYSSLF